MPKIREDAPERIDAYIAKAADFARPICERLRELIHAADPKIVEDWKWGPNFHREGMVCGIGAFKRHVSLHFFKGSLMKDAKGLFRDAADDKGSRSLKFASVGEIPATAVKAYVKEAVKLNISGAKVAVKKPPARMPADLSKALKAAPTAAKYFEGLAPGYRREYIEWVTSAKRDATREKRIAATVERCAKGETLNEKYRKKR
ncbi:MAG: YdeI/OmpD-associated family protein [Planctomycetota bacterium]